VIPRNIPIIKELISHISYAEAAESISHLGAISDPQEVVEWLKNLNKKFLGDLLDKLPIEVDV
ncbi:MAG: hypothetical protein N2053_06360, partial [Chitinispirillaceae bacterium]|nr:hypothetical protein [Chitinispirillaceae bacterium]